MNKFIQFVNRKEELEFLNRQVERGGALVVLYGRRRVGKSELLKHFAKGRNALYLLATQEVEKEVMAGFSADAAKFFGDPGLEINPLETFAQFMEYLGRRELKGTVLIIDEFPYLVDAQKAAPSIIQKHWETRLKGTGLSLILCGSSIGAMETNVLGRKSPLYGRRTGQWKLEPLSFAHFAKFFPGVGMEKLVELYSITGGIPLYVLEFDGNKSTYENAKDAIATRGSILYQEADILLREELREPRIYFSILKEMAAGKNTPNELANMLGVERTLLARYLNTLITLDIVEAARPALSGKKSRSTIYVLKDNYFRFWFGFVSPFRKDLDSFDFSSFRENFCRNFSTYVGKQFEQVCKEAVCASGMARPSETGSWWGAYREGGERKVAEIDIAAVKEKSLLLAECRWTNKAVDVSDLEALVKKSALVPSRKSREFAYFSKSGFTSGAAKFAAENSWRLFTLKDLERILLGQEG